MQEESICRFRKKADGNIDHVIECSKLAHEECQRRHNLGNVDLWKPVRKCYFKAKDQ